eukprot:CAMPEP_0170520452 /NCGR_PEP_ID=MMETSP0209-20121228/5732_1 /TAXON_ID=665100 ORGANISM="Litonotus pictus, Strain P1" /NCGR_SAMPLE_ID=MMETSP0209 /ASSEMBLY_ACC=CAM_ASM_000301 /LENGTH=220 /DNA_ID=CAMNT_0010806739 /DNA_START=238 /DNA_END=900 /DNA_ORIENTATION=+
MKNESIGLHESKSIEENQDHDELTDNRSGHEALHFIKLDKKGIPTKGNTYYSSLGVEEKASLRSIKKNYILIAKKFHPDHDEKYLEYFSYICSAYDVLKDEQRRAVYDDELLLQKRKAWYIKVLGFNVNIIYFFGFALATYIASLYLENFISVKDNYYCPLGENKYSITDLKSHDDNLKLLKIVEASTEDMNTKKNSMNKIAEDEEYEYYVETKPKSNKH